MTTLIGKVLATEKAPSTVDEFHFWTKKDFILKPFDVIKVSHIKGSKYLESSTTFGVIEEISHITDASSFLAGYISSDFGNVNIEPNTERVGMNYVKARVVGNTQNICTPVLDGSKVSLANEEDIKNALGLSNIKNPLPCGYITMYEENSITIPVHFNSHFLIGPEGAHLNISGISGLASKTSYAMFLLKAIQAEYQKTDRDDSVAFVILNVKGRDLLALDEANEELNDEDKTIYKNLEIKPNPFENVKYFYPFAGRDISGVTYGRDFDSQKHENKAFQYKYTFEEDKEKIDMLFANIDDSTGTMESIVAQITSKNSDFANITNWSDFKEKLGEYRQSGNASRNNEISVLSWRKFSRHFTRILEKSPIFSQNIDPNKSEVRLEDAIQKIKKNEVFVVDVAKLDDEIQGFVFGDVINAIYDLKLGQVDDRDESDIPSKIIIFIDELNKYASNDVPKNSPILRKLLEVTERGRSLGIILFSVEQFKSVIHERVKGNCSTHAYGRTNVIEASKKDYNHILKVYKSMMTRLDQGEYILENPVFRSLLNTNCKMSLN
jgi:uncharacterized protein